MKVSVCGTGPMGRPCLMASASDGMNLNSPSFNMVAIMWCDRFRISTSFFA